AKKAVATDTHRGTDKGVYRDTNRQTLDYTNKPDVTSTDDSKKVSTGKDSKPQIDDPRSRYPKPPVKTDDDAAVDSHKKKSDSGKSDNHAKSDSVTTDPSKSDKRVKTTDDGDKPDPAPKKHVAPPDDPKSDTGKGGTGKSDS